MRSKRTLTFGLFSMVLAGLIAAGSGGAEERNQPFPSYGSGSVEVRIYTDYFCPPCRAAEPGIETILKDLLKKNAIRLTLVDVFLHPLTPLFSRNFLYALKGNNDWKHALRVRKILMEASTNKEMNTQKRIGALFKKKWIAYGIWATKHVEDRYKAMQLEDKIQATPTCVVIKNGQKKSFIGGDDIINALKALQ